MASWLRRYEGTALRQSSRRFCVQTVTHTYDDTYTNRIQSEAPEGANKGLVLAEIELQSEDESFELPPWAGEEVSVDPRYYNNNLVKHPFKDW